MRISVSHFFNRLMHADIIAI